MYPCLHVCVYCAYQQLDSLSSLPPTVGDGRLGYPDMAPYDAIHVGAAAAVVPDEVSITSLIPRRPSQRGTTSGVLPIL